MPRNSVNSFIGTCKNLKMLIFFAELVPDMNNSIFTSARNKQIILPAQSAPQNKFFLIKIFKTV
jgi:hypothetical protein